MSIKNGFLVFLNTRLYGGSTTLKPEDIGLDAKNLPPSEIAQLGKKFLINPKDLTRVQSAAKAVRYKLEQKAVKVEGAFFVPEAIADSVLKEVDAAIDEAKGEIEGFLNNFEQKAQAWRDSHPEWDGLLGSVPTRDTLAGRMKIKRTAVRVGEIEGGEEEFANSLLGEILSSMHDVGAHLYRMAQNEVLKGRSMMPVRSLQKKLTAYGFLSPDLFQLAHDLGEILAGKNRDLEGDEKAQIAHAAHMLARKDILECVKVAVAEGRNSLEASEEEQAVQSQQSLLDGDRSDEAESSSPAPDAIPEIPVVPVKKTPAQTRAVIQAFF